MSSIPTNAMPHAKTDTPVLDEAQSSWADTSLERLTQGRDALLASVKAHPASAATAAAVLIGGLAVSTIPALRRGSTATLKRAKQSVESAIGAAKPTPTKRARRSTKARQAAA